MLTPHTVHFYCCQAKCTAGTDHVTSSIQLIDNFFFLFPAAAGAAAASYMPPYAAYATLPQAALPAGGVLPGLSPYPPQQPSLQEARMQ